MILPPTAYSPDDTVRKGNKQARLFSTTKAVYKVQKVEASLPLTTCQSYFSWQGGGIWFCPLRARPQACQDLEMENLRGFIKKSLSTPEGGSAALGLA